MCTHTRAPYWSDGRNSTSTSFFFYWCKKKNSQLLTKTPKYLRLILTDCPALHCQGESHCITLCDHQHHLWSNQSQENLLMSALIKIKSIKYNCSGQVYLEHQIINVRFSGLKRSRWYRCTAAVTRWGVGQSAISSFQRQMGCSCRAYGGSYSLKVSCCLSHKMHSYSGQADTRSMKLSVTERVPSLNHTKLCVCWPGEISPVMVS